MSIVRHVPLQWDVPSSWMRQGWDSDFFNSERQLRLLDQEMRDMNLRSGTRDLNHRSDFRDSHVSFPSYDPHYSLRLMDREMKRMTEEMNRMFTQVQHLVPLDAEPETWRMRENFLLDNPVVHDRDGSKRFRLQFDVRQFKPEEIIVKTAGRQLSVHAKHDEKGDNKSVFCEYHRHYTLPGEMNPESLVSKLSKDGLLTIEAPLPSLEGPREKLIPIEHN